VTVGTAAQDALVRGKRRNSDLSALNRRSEPMPSSQCPFAPDPRRPLPLWDFCGDTQRRLLCERIDQQVFTGDILGRLKRQIATARVVVAGPVRASANVLSRSWGFAWGSNVPTVLLCQEDHELKFDVQGERCLRYASIRNVERTANARVEWPRTEFERQLTGVA